MQSVELEVCLNLIVSRNLFVEKEGHLFVLI